MLRSERNTATECHNTAISQATLSGFVALVYDVHQLLPLLDTH